MNYSQIKMALVDFDGTLVDSTGCWVEAYQLLCETKSIQPLKTVIDSFNQIDFTKWQELIFAQVGECNDELIECAKTTFAKRSPKQQVFAIINSLSNDCHISVISNEPNELIEHWLSAYKFKVFSSINIVLGDRDSPDFYKRGGLLLIDDNYKHCLAAKLANASVIGVNDYHTKERKTQMREVCNMYIDN